MRRRGELSRRRFAPGFRGRAPDRRATELGDGRFELTVRLDQVGEGFERLGQSAERQQRIRSRLLSAPRRKLRQTLALRQRIGCLRCLERLLEEVPMEVPFGPNVMSGDEPAFGASSSWSQSAAASLSSAMVCSRSSRVCARSAATRRCQRILELTGVFQQHVESARPRGGRPWRTAIERRAAGRLGGVELDRCAASSSAASRGDHGRSRAARGQADDLPLHQALQQALFYAQSSTSRRLTSTHGHQRVSRGPLRQRAP